MIYVSFFIEIITLLLNCQNVFSNCIQKTSHLSNLLFTQNVPQISSKTMLTEKSHKFVLKLNAKCFFSFLL